MKEEIYGFIEEVENIQPFFIQIAGISYCDGSYRISRENSDIYVFEYIIEGEGTVCLDGTKFTAKAGDIYILNKNSNHYYYSDSKNPWTKVWFNAKGPLIDTLLQVYNIGNVNYITGLDIQHLFLEIFNICKHSNGVYNHSIEKCSIVLHKIIAKISTYILQSKTTFVCGGAEKIKYYLDTNVKERVSLEEISKEIYLSQSQMIRLFKKVYKTTPYNYLMDRKIEFAKIMLLNSNSSVKEISVSLGFKDQQYFSNYFKEKVGTSPSKFRQDR